MLEHKGYMGHVEFDEEADLFHGEVINTRDVITFQGETVKQLKQAFIDSVEDYLSFCEARDESPERLAREIRTPGSISEMWKWGQGYRGTA